MQAITQGPSAIDGSPRDHLRATIRAELAKHNPLEVSRGALEIIAETSLRCAEENGSAAFHVVDEQGNPRTSVRDGQVTNLTVQDLVAELRQKHHALFEPSRTESAKSPKRPRTGPRRCTAEQRSLQAPDAAPEPTSAPTATVDPPKKSRKRRAAAADIPEPQTPARPRRLVAILAAEFSVPAWGGGKGAQPLPADIQQWRREIIEPSLTENGGTFIRWVGNSLLTAFDSPQDAVHCAMVVGNLLRCRNRQLPLQARLNCRIGVDLGEVVFEADAVYGDAVTVAERLAALARVGAIHISGGMYEQISNRLVCKFRARGDVPLAGIAHAVRIYEVTPLPLLKDTRFRFSRPVDLIGAVAAVVIGGVLGLGIVNAPRSMDLIGVSTAYATQGQAQAAAPLTYAARR